MSKLTPEEIAAEALKLYKPPFKHMHGYIYDAADSMVSDNGVEIDDAMMHRIRGYGRISYMEHPHDLQDAVGVIVAEALTDYWEKHTRQYIGGKK